MQWRVYYLYSKILDNYYIGKTNDLDRRISEHNLGQETYTKRGKPWKLVGYIDCADSTEAYHTEKKLKKAKNKKYVRWFVEKHGILLIKSSVDR